MRQFIILFFIFAPSILMAQNKVKFMLFADLHYDIMPDADERLQAVLDKAESKDVDFILELGDFIPATNANSALRDKLNVNKIPVYHTLGNHDIDENDKQTYLDYWNIPASYYYFDRGIFRFVVLDSDFFLDKDGNIKSYNKGNYAQASETERNKYGKEQLAWLENLLKDKGYVYVLFSHAPVNDQYAAVALNRDLHSILLEAKKGGTRIAMVFGGHMHSDNYHLIDGIHYMQVNSISNIWGGAKFINTQRYTEAAHRKYPSLKYVIPYEDALFAVVEVDNKGKIKIQGVKSRYIKPEPDKELLKTKPYPCSPIISTLKLKF